MKTFKSLTLLLLVVPVLLSGCDRRAQPREWQPYDPVVQAQTAREDLRFARGQATLSQHHVQQLADLTRGYDMAASVSVRIFTHNTADKLKQHPLRQRIQGITQVMTRRGVSRGNIEIISDAVSGGYSDIITVEADQHIAMAPKCNGWNYSMDRFLRPEGEMDFGCTTAANLAVLVANPQDLLRGQPLGKGDAARNDLYIDNYRKDKVKPLMKEEKFSTK